MTHCVDQLSHPRFRLVTVGVSIGGNHALTHRPGDLDFGVIITGEQDVGAPSELPSSGVLDPSHLTDERTPLHPHLGRAGDDDG